MSNRAGLFPLVLLVALLFGATMGRAEEPVASAPIPPPLPTPYVAPSTPPAPAAKAGPATTQSRPPAKDAAKEVAKEPPKEPLREPSKEMTKKGAAAGHKKTEVTTAAAHRPSRIKRGQRHTQIAHTAPPRSPQHPRYYHDEMVPGPMAEAPPFPPPWYGRPFPGYPFGPRGPMPW